MKPCKENACGVKTKSYKTLFCIQDETHIDEMWEFCNEFTNFTDFQTELVTSIIRFVYHASKCQKKKKIQESIKIYFEYSDDAIYVSFQDKCLGDILNKKESIFSDLKYQLSDGTISIKIDAKENFEMYEEYEEHDEDFTQYDPIISAQSREKIIYDLIDSESLISMQEIIDDLHAELILIEKKGFNERSVDKLVKLSVDYIGFISYHQQIYPIKAALDELVLLMQHHKNELIEKKALFVTAFSGIAKSIQIWQDELFVNGTEDMHFLDKSIQADVSMISNLLTHEESEVEEVDDLFF